MDHNFLVVAHWILLALVASILSICFGISVALMEITVGVVGGNIMPLEITPWVKFLAALWRGNSYFSGWGGN